MFSYLENAQVASLICIDEACISSKSKKFRRTSQKSRVDNKFNSDLQHKEVAKLMFCRFSVVSEEVKLMPHNCTCTFSLMSTRCPYILKVILVHENKI